MPNRENISVSLTKHQAEFLASCIASGRYQSASEVVREGLRLLEDQHRLRNAELARLRGLARTGANQPDRRKVVVGDTSIRERDAELPARKPARRRKRN